MLGPLVRALMQLHCSHVRLPLLPPLLPLLPALLTHGPACPQLLTELAPGSAYKERRSFCVRWHGCVGCFASDVLAPSVATWPCTSMLACPSPCAALPVL